MDTAAAFGKHMRLGFQLLLAPLFLWGLLLAGESPGWRAAAGFVSLHLFLYPGATAFNAAYDRDSGPVSGLPRPPPPPPGLLGFSLLLQLAGAAVAALAGGAFLLLYLLLGAVFLAYSHPALRWKASPTASAAAVALGQGGLGFAAGWCAGTGALPPADATAAAGAVAAALTALGLYPSTQIFQVDEDRARGDRTLAVALGAPRALRFGAACLGAAGFAAATLFAARGQWGPAGLLAAGYALLIARHRDFAARLDGLEPAALYRWATATRLIATAGFLAFLLLLLAGDELSRGR